MQQVLSYIDSSLTLFQEKQQSRSGYNYSSDHENSWLRSKEWRVRLLFVLKFTGQTGKHRCSVALIANRINTEI